MSILRICSTNDCASKLSGQGRLSRLLVELVWHKALVVQESQNSHHHLAHEHGAGLLATETPAPTENVMRGPNWEYSWVI